MGARARAEGQRGHGPRPQPLANRDGPPRAVRARGRVERARLRPAPPRRERRARDDLRRQGEAGRRGGRAARAARGRRARSCSGASRSARRPWCSPRPTIPRSPESSATAATARSTTRCATTCSSPAAGAGGLRSCRRGRSRTRCSSGWAGAAAFDPAAVDVRAAAARLAGRPALFVANSDDRRMPKEIAFDLRAAAGKDAEVLIVPGKSHGGAWRDGTAAYQAAAQVVLRPRGLVRPRAAWRAGEGSGSRTNDGTRYDELAREDRDRGEGAPPPAVPRGGQRGPAAAARVVHHGRAAVPGDLLPVLQGDLPALEDRPQDEGAHRHRARASPRSARAASRAT